MDMHGGDRVHIRASGFAPSDCYTGEDNTNKGKEEGKNHKCMWTRVSKFSGKSALQILYEEGNTFNVIVTKN